MVIERTRRLLTVPAAGEVAENVETKGDNLSVEVVSDQPVNVYIKTLKQTIIANVSSTTRWIWTSQPGDLRVYPGISIIIENTSATVNTNVEIYINQGRIL